MACRDTRVCYLNRILLIVILLVIALILVRYENMKNNPPVKNFYKSLIDSTTIDKLDSIVIRQHSKKRTIILVKRDSYWEVKNRNWKMGKTAYEDLMEALKSLRREELVSLKPDSSLYKKLDLTDDKNTILELFSKGKLEYKFIFGKNATGYNLLYYKDAKSGNIYIVSGVSKYFLDRAPELLISKELYKVNPDSIESFYLENREKNKKIDIEVKRVGQDSVIYKVTYNDTLIKNIKEVNVKAYLTTMSRILMFDVLKDPQDPKEYEDYKISLIIRTPNRVLEYRMKESKDKNDNIYYLAMDMKTHRVFKMSKWVVNGWFKKRDYFEEEKNTSSKK